MRAVDLLSRAREASWASMARDLRERRRRVCWAVGPAAHSQRGDRVAVVVVNHNTRRLICELVFSLHRVLDADEPAAVVVVDNASSDGSFEFLRALAGAGLIHLIANRRQRYHGSGLNQGISWLADRQARVAAAERVDYVWVLDSDTVVLRGDTLRDALAALRDGDGAVIGESWGTRDGYPHLAVPSLLLDVARVWRPEVAPFRDDGEPERRLLETASDARLALCPFPFLHDSYVLHLGSGTLVEVARGEWRNRFYGWATRHHAEAGAASSYSHHPLGPRLHAALREAYRREVGAEGAGGESPESLVAACRREERLTFPEARPLPPRAELQRAFDAGLDLTEYVLAHQRRAGG